MACSAALRILSRVLVAVVPLGDPARRGPSSSSRSASTPRAPDVVERLVFELAEADDDVGDLDAGVVDVVLDLDLAPLEAEQPSERVAGRRVAEVADVRRLVRIDRGVLDDGLVAGPARDPVSFRASAGRPSHCCSQYGRSRKRLRYPFGAASTRLTPSIGAEGAGELLRDRARRLAQAAGEREGDRDGDVAERALRRRFERQLGDRGIVGGKAVEAADGLGHAARERGRWTGRITVNYSVIRSSDGFSFSSTQPLARS